MLLVCVRYKLSAPTAKSQGAQIKKIKNHVQCANNMSG